MSGLELHEAASTGDYDTLLEYLQTGKYDVNLRDADWKNKTPLHWAAEKGFVDCVRLLVEYGAVGTCRMSMGWTPAHSAAEAGRLAVLRALHAAHLPVICRDKYGDTPRRIAQIYGHTDCIHYLQQVEAELAASGQDIDQDGEEDQWSSDNEIDDDDDGYIDECCIKNDVIDHRRSRDKGRKSVRPVK